MHNPDHDVLPFSIEVTPARDGATVVSVAGELDLATTPQLREVLLDPRLCPGPEVVVDLRAVSFIDSAGLGALVVGRRRLTEDDGTLAVRCTDGPVARALTMTGLDQVLTATVDPA